MGELVKGFGVYGAKHSNNANSKSSYVWYNAFSAKTPPGAGSICIPSPSSYTGIVPPALTGIAFNQIANMSFFVQDEQLKEKKIDYALLAVSASPASGSVTGATLNLGELSLINTTSNNITLVSGQTYTIDPIPANGGAEYILYQKITLDYTPVRDRLIVPYVVLPGSPAPVTFNFVLTIYFSSDLT